jgi:hypothetical protein
VVDLIVLGAYGVEGADGQKLMSLLAAFPRGTPVPLSDHPSSTPSNITPTGQNVGMAQSGVSRYERPCKFPSKY